MAVVPENDADRCMKCGFCMSTCPVYAVDHLETHVARGRNMLIRDAAKGEAIADRGYRDALSYCLLCKRCEAVCPAKVPSTRITLSARKRLMDSAGLSMPQRVIHRLILKHRSALARILGLSVILPGMGFKNGKPLRHLADLGSVLLHKISIPKMPGTFLSNRLPGRIQPPDGVSLRGKVAFFPGCNYEYFFPEVGLDVVSALSEAGFEVMLPKDLTCCGLAVYNTGDHSAAQRLAENNIRALSGFDHIVTACATCGTALKSYGEWFPENHPTAENARLLSEKVMEFSELMAGADPFGWRAPPGLSVVTYHDPCHLRWHQGIVDAPRKILKSIQGLRFVEMELAEKCCGQGGSFGIKHPDESLAMLARKMESARKTGAQAIVTSCPGCMIQLMDGVRRHGLSMDVIHISRLMRKM